MPVIELILHTEADLLALGSKMSVLVGNAGLITLSGDLGAGKTTLVRGLLHGAGHVGPVKSPTFSLVEPYNLQLGNVYHFDFYRLQNAEELDYIGMRDYLDEASLCLVEWPEKAEEFLPAADINIMISKLEQGRRVRLETHTDRGQALFAKLALRIDRQESEHRSG